MKIIERRDINIPEPNRFFVLERTQGETVLVDTDLNCEYVIDLEGESVNMGWTDYQWWNFIYFDNHLWDQR